jgi:hypothetical protein
MTYKKNCATCNLVRGNTKLRIRIRDATFNRTAGDETLQDIGREIGVNNKSIYNHSKKHITNRADTSEQVREAKLAKAKIAFAASVQRENELALKAQTMDEVDARPAEIVGLDEYIAQGILDVRKGNMKMTPASFLGAIKVKTEWAAKQQNNKLELMRTMMAFASGNKNKKDKDDDITIEVTTSTPTGEDESSRLFRATFGDAAPQGSETLYREPTETQSED